MNRNDFEQRLAKLTNSLMQTLELVKAFEKTYAEKSELKRMLVTSDNEYARFRDTLTVFTRNLEEHRIRQYVETDIVSDLWEGA